MSTILRFVAANETTVTLDLNSTTGFKLGRGFQLGTPPEEQAWLTQQPYDGATLAATRTDITIMSVPLVLMPQATWAAVKTLFDALAVELRRNTNIIEFRPHGAAASYFIDTYRAPVPSLFRGVDLQSVAHRLWDAEIPVLIPRHPVLRGAGAFI